VKMIRTDELLSLGGDELLEIHLKSNNYTINIWYASIGELCFSLEDHSYWISSLSFNSKGDRLYSGSGDSRIISWQIEN